MDAHKKEGFFSNFKQDFSASIVVFLVALPLCLGIALASGAPLFSGIIAGIVGGIVVALFSGSPLGVSGPAAGLAVIVFTGIQDLGAYPTFLLAVVLAGGVQLVLGFLKAGVIGYYFPSSVIKGMLSGIGILIILKQIPHAMGYDKDPAGDFGFSQVDGHNTFSEFFYMFDFISPGAIVIAVVSLGILILWDRPFIKRIALLNSVPGPLIAVASGIGLNIIFQNLPSLALRPDQMVDIPMATSFAGFLDLFTVPDFTQILNPEVHVLAFTIAVVASLETLLCVEATDKLDPQKRITPTNRELKAQGLGNIFSGLVGGLPVTQVIVRSSANIQAGGKSKASAFIHGILLLISALAIPMVLNKIPLASLASILFMVGYKLTKPALFKEMYKSGREHFIPFLVTVNGIVFTDLLTGIVLGLSVAIVYILWNNYLRPYTLQNEEYEDGEAIRISMAEEMTFLNKASISRTLNHVPDNTHVVLDATNTKNMHLDVLEIIQDFEENAKTRGVDLECVGFSKTKGLAAEDEFRNVILKEEKKERRLRIPLFLFGGDD